MKNIYHALNQIGDTIVEVLICLAIASLALGLSYGIARRNLIQVRDAEERQELLKLVEEQLERLQAVAPTKAKSVGDSDCTSNGWVANRCFKFNNTAGNVLAFCIQSDLSISVYNNATLNTQLSSSSDAQCRSSNPLYRALLYYDPDHGHNPDNEFYAIGINSSLLGPEANARGYGVITDMYRLHP